MNLVSRIVHIVSQLMVINQLRHSCDFSIINCLVIDHYITQIQLEIRLPGTVLYICVLHAGLRLFYSILGNCVTRMCALFLVLLSLTYDPFPLPGQLMTKRPNIQFFAVKKTVFYLLKITLFFTTMFTGKF